MVTVNFIANEALSDIKKKIKNVSQYVSIKRVSLLRFGVWGCSWGAGGGGDYLVKLPRVFS